MRDSCTPYEDRAATRNQNWAYQVVAVSESCLSGKRPPTEANGDEAATFGTNCLAERRCISRHDRYEDVALGAC